VVVNKKNAKILALDFSNGKKHDFKLFKESKIRTNSNTTILADTGYLGIQKIISNSRIPHKRSKKHPLTKEQKKENREISSKRVLCENVIGSVKRFRILSERYRNRRKRFGLRFNLIAGIHNFELG
jgi:IS5 family transposase